MLEEESKDSPWLTTTDIERVSEELHYLKQFDQATNEYRDIIWMYFRREVLNKYRNNDLCEIGDEYIGFLHHDKKAVASTVNFVNRNFANINGIVLMLQAQEYINVPPTERSHWEQYEIPESQIQFK
ncbi:MAG: hypothetical protein ACJ71R_20560 [Nitrososphaeraceae archaeon]